ncbi:MAG: exosortase/archaeosortase family protein [Sphingomonadaceae bacterium]|nr:exosortase/archaeosortase family protein [Sphingomonadaceae bacterium]
MLERIERPQLHAVLVTVLALNALATHIFRSWAKGWQDAALSLLGINAIVWIALLAIVAIACEPGEAEPGKPGDRLVAAWALLAALFPSPPLAGAALFLLAVRLAWTSPPASRSRRIALIALALSGRVLWGKLALGLFGGPIATLESAILPWLTGLRIDGNVLTAIDGETTFVVAASCSSVANLSLVLILGVTAAQVFRLPLGKPLWLAMAGGMLTVVALNTLRLAGFGYYPEYFDYWHSGPGAALFGHGILLTIGLALMVGVAHAQKRAA